MKRFLLTILLSCYTLYGFSLSVGDKEYVRFEHFSTREGLSSNRVFSIAQDSTGFVWVATDFGLDRFDGINFKHHQSKDYPSMNRNDIMYVGHLGNDRIVAGGFSGLFIEYDRKKDAFIDRMPAELDSTGYSQIRGVYTSETGERYLQTNGGVYRYDPETDTYNSHFPAFESLRIDFVNTMYIDQAKRYWIGAINHLHIVDAAGKKVKEFNQMADNCGYVSSITAIAPDKVLVTFQSNELWIMDSSKEIPAITERVKLPFQSVMRMIKTDDGRYWFATDGDGLWYTDEEPSSSARFVNLVPYGELQTEMRKIYGITKGKNGEIWFGTQNAGIWSYNRKNSDCVTFSGDLGLPTVVCSSFQEGEDGTIYVGTDGNGIYAISADKEQIKHYDLPNNSVTGLYKDGNHLLATTWGSGVLDYDLQTGKTSTIDFKGIERPVQMFFSIGATPSGMLWACSANDDLYVKDSTWRKITLHDDSFPQIVSKWIVKVIPGERNSLWVLSTNMLWHVENGKTTAVRPDLFFTKSHDPYVIYDAESDEEGNLFAASNLGIFRYSKEGDEVERLDFLPNYFFRIIKQDKQGRFWSASFDGIIYFDYDKREYAHLPGDYDDISKSFFYIKAGFRDSKGNIYLGTNGGFYSFDPANVNPDLTIQHMAFSELYISRKKIEPGTSALCDGNISELDKITLSHGMTDISIAVDIIDHVKFNKAKIRYRLLGMQEDWIEIGNNRFINFNHIPTGKYQLEVEAYRPHLKETRKISLGIVVTPPWWATWWFLLLVVLALLTAIYLLFRRRLHKLEEEQLILQKRVDERTSELKDALLDKDKLISVIAHDLKNPMFAIVGALETWRNKGKEMKEEEQRQLVEDTYESSVTLQKEMLNLLDWAKSKRDEIICHPSDIDLKFVINNVVLLLKGMMDDKKITLEQNHQLTHCAFADSRMMGTVIRNLLSNAIKFTPKNGTIQITSRQEGERIIVEVKDSGVGMDEAKIRELTSSEAVTSTAGTEQEKGTGLGFRICQDYIHRNNGNISLQSQKGVGTTIRIELPASVKVLSQQQAVTEKSDEIAIDRTVLEGNTVLIVDDDPLICNNIKNILSEYVQTLLAKDGQEAMQIAEREQPDLILSDVDMPILDGIEMCKQLSQSAKSRHIPILFISANNEENDRLRGLLSGAIDYIAKPFSPSELLLKTYNLLNLRKEQQKHLMVDLMVKGEQPAANQEEKEERLNPFLKEFLRIVEEKHTESQITMDDLARAMAVSQPTLNRKIRSLTGKTPLEVLNEYRLNHALRLFQDSSSDNNVAEVAYSVGFNDPSYFTKKFRDFFGYLPSQVQKR